MMQIFVYYQQKKYSEQFENVCKTRLAILHSETTLPQLLCAANQL